MSFLSGRGGGVSVNCSVTPALTRSFARTLMAPRIIRAIVLASAVSTVVVPAPAVAQTGVDVRGTITDRAHQAVAGATVSIPELGRATNTGSDGRFRISGVPNGRFTVAIRRVGYLSSAVAIVVAGS